MKFQASLYSWGDWFETLFVNPSPRRQVFSQRGPYDTKQFSVLRKKIPKKKGNASGFSSFHRHGRRHFFHTTQLTHISLTSFLWGIGKQCRTRWDPAERGIWSGSPSFAYRMFYKNLRKWKWHPVPLKMKSPGPIEWRGGKWIKQKFSIFCLIL